MQLPVMASAPAKIILLGEHAVVHGSPALAVPVHDVRATVQIQPSDNGMMHLYAHDLKTDYVVTPHPNADEPGLLHLIRRLLSQLEITDLPAMALHIRSQIPIASGMGSGAAVSTATARAVLAAYEQAIPLKELNAIVYEAEQLYHGRPSGIDNTVIVYESPVFFVRGKAPELLRFASPQQILIADTGVEAPTRTAVNDVAQLLKKDQAAPINVLDAITDLVHQARSALEAGSTVALGQLMTENHRLLQRLTVSSPELDRLAQAAQDAGAYGAKLSGGGRGGNMIALVDTMTSDKVEAALYLAGATHVYRTVIA
ncbi:mevalonate kinase [bacterium]|nr:mevalonate kinase [bacterium]